MIEYPRRNHLARLPTPLQPLHRASERWGRGHRLWVKRDDLTGCTLTGNKVRKLEFITAYAQDKGFDTLITCGGLQSNHCRAAALVGAEIGMPTPGGCTVGNPFSIPFQLSSTLRTRVGS